MKIQGYSVVKEEDMTMEELLLRELPGLAAIAKPYDTVRKDLPEEIRSCCSLFRTICSLGGRFPVPPIFIRQDPNEHSGIYLEKGVILNGRVVPFVLLNIHVKEALKTLEAYQKMWNTPPRVVGLDTAVHEARHVCQMYRVIGEWHDKKWIQAWIKSHRPDLEKDMSPLILRMIEEAASHARATARKQGSRKERLRSILHEQDADLTEIAAILTHQKEKNLHAVARIVHG